MSERKMTPGTLQFLQEGVRRGGRVSMAANSSWILALKSRGYIDDSGHITDAGKAAADTDNRNIVPCSRCGSGIEVMYSIPIGDELCRTCGQRANRTTKKKGSEIQDYHYHGYRRDMDV